jgi:hypothetical protein
MIVTSKVLAGAVNSALTFGSASGREEEFVKGVREFRQTPNEAKLARLLTGLSEMQSSESWDSSLLVLRGWASRRRAFLRAIRRANPDYQLWVRRSGRADLRVFAPKHGIRLGFILVARSRTGVQPFTLLVHRGASPDLLISPSNEVAHTKLVSLGSLPRESAWGGDNKAFIDEVLEVPIGGLSFDQIVTRHPEEVLELVETAAGAYLAKDVLAVFAQSVVTSRERDRASVLVDGISANMTSDLVKLRVNRLDVHCVDSHSLALPEPTRTGSLVRYRPGEKLMPRPSSFWHRLTDVQVQSGGTVSTPTELIVVESASDPALDFVSGQWDHVYGFGGQPDVALMRKFEEASEEIPEAILISGRNDANWYHWIAEYLPRVLSIPRSIGQDVPLLVSDRVPGSGLGALRALSARAVITVDAQRSSRVGVLHTLAPVTQVLDTTNVPWREGIALDAPSLKRMTEALVVAADAKDMHAYRQVFLSRRSKHRGLVNEAQLASLARREGLEVVDPSALDWREQVQLFRSAKLVVGAGGAVMANYLFMSPGARAVALTSEALSDFILPAALAQVSGATFTSLLGTPQVRLDQAASALQWMHSSYTVSAGDFVSVLRNEMRALPVSRDALGTPLS